MAITATTGATANNAVAGVSLAFASAAQTSGQFIVVGVAILTPASVVSSITDGTNTYTLRSAQNNGSNCRVEIWTATVASSATRTITINFSGSTLASAAWQEYAGSTGLGNIAGSFSANSWYPEADVATQDNGSWMVAACSIATNSGDTITSDVGTIRRSLVPALTTAAIALVDNTGIYSTTQNKGAVKLSASRNWVGTALEMRTGVSPFTLSPVNVVVLSDANVNTHHQTVRAPANAQTSLSSTGNTGFVG